MNLFIKNKSNTKITNARLRELVIIIIVLATGYFVLFAHRFDFGTARDYVSTLFRGLGLTKTGGTLLNYGTPLFKGFSKS